MPSLVKLGNFFFFPFELQCIVFVFRSRVQDLTGPFVSIRGYDRGVDNVEGDEG